MWLKSIFSVLGVELIHREIDDPAEPVNVLFDQVQQLAEMRAQPGEDAADLGRIRVRQEDNRVSRLGTCQPE